MSRKGYAIGLMASLLMFSWGFGSPVPKPKPTPREDQTNSNALLKKFFGQLQVEASSTWSGYPVQNLIDDKLESTWYSENGDCRGKEREPWVQVVLPEPSSVSRVTFYGSRDPQFPVGYGILEGQLLLINNEGKTIMRITRDARGEKKDFDFLLAEDCPKVKVIRFRVVKDDTVGSPNSVACVALAEIRVE